MLSHAGTVTVLPSVPTQENGFVSSYVMMSCERCVTVVVLS